MESDLPALQAGILNQIAAASSLEALEAVRLESLGKSGAITVQLKTLGTLPPEQRKDVGAAINVVRDIVTTALTTRKSVLEEASLEATLAAQRVDVTLPARPRNKGTLHPIRQTIRDITAIFARQGFTLAEGPDVEDDFHNFTALNIPAHHPARAMHDTFYLNSGHVLRTHTSPVQIRTLEKGQLPLRILAAGRTYRCDSDQTHTPMFHQVEGLVVEEGITFAHLKGTIQAFLQEFFALPSLNIRLRPSFFPFTEPSAEVDIQCRRDKGSLVLGEGEDWLEVLGCGMVHQNVFTACGLPATTTGFAFGMGVERLAMLKYGIPDLRTFFESDLRWLRHYGFSVFN